MNWGTRLILSTACAGLLAGCGDDSSDSSSSGGSEGAGEVSFNASIARTTHGTAHITADNYGSLGFGQGYAFAEDRFCTLMDQIVKVRSERAKYFGPDDDNIAENGPGHIASDISYLAMDVQGRAVEQVAQLDSNTKAMLSGYVAGFNAYLDETGAANLPGDCAGEPWVSPIADTDLMAYYLDLATLAGTRQLLPALANAKPPASAMVMTNPLGDDFKVVKDHASNGIAIGRDLSAGEGGVLLSNTHLPWEDELKYHEVHLTIPDELDVVGVSLSGGLGVQIGFNQNMAWTHTTSPSNQFVIYRLTLAADDPTAYMVDGEKKQMVAREVSIDVAGLEAPYTQTVYSSEFGPILQAPSQGLAWDNTQAFAIHDPNIDNGAFLATFLEMAKAQSVRELRQVFLANGGVPWNHTMATDSSGETLYADTTFVPFLLPGVETAYLDAALTPENESEKAVAGAFQSGIVLMDGSRSITKPVVVPGVRVKGSIPFEKAPYTFRTDYVMNSNDSFWLPNLDETLEAFSRLYGDAGEMPRSFRTRMGLTQIEELAPDTVTKESLQDLLFANRSFTENLWRSDLCTDAPATLDEACGIIANWDGRYNLASHGAALFREALTAVKALEVNGEIDGTQMFATPFDPASPLNTPSGLTPEGKALLQSGLTDAVDRLSAQGLELDVALGDVQFTKKGDTVIPIHGGLQKIDGAFNKVEYRGNPAMYTSTLPQMDRAPVVNEPTNLTEEGYLINYGASYVMTVEFGDDGPKADALLTYGQSNHTGSPYFKDQTELYSTQTWRPVPFTAQAVTDATVSEKTVRN
ncbi:penicillin acylase family protein [Marinobacter fonticola]|uniref:penicillin acylase family protein n=1 Tax=Marinobacter fonticola TaxID=2603215 RepID=UPI00143D184C|nr:penicillin acylase family protein [Marinobacter fonticola]